MATTTSLSEYYQNLNDTTSRSVSGSNKTDDSLKWSFEFSVVLACILSVSAFCTVVGNSMVLMVIIRHRGMRTRTNLFLLNLAITDLLVGLLVEPFSITTLIHNDWVFGEELCKLNGWMNSFCLVTSFHTLMYISIHKYFSIVRPLSNPLKLAYIIMMMICAWLWAAICSTLNIAVLVVEYKAGTSQCGPRYPNTPGAYIVHGVLQFTVIYLPAAILVFCYVRMFIAIKKHSQRLRTNSTVEEDFILSQQKKVTMTLFIVLATFVMMALPYNIYATYVAIEIDKEHFPSIINPLAYMFLYLSSMCNPIIYAFRSPAFREGYKEILCQTPNYVISDESDQVPRTRRLSSIISALRRSPSVRSSSNKVVQSADNIPLAVSPTDVGEKRSKPKFYRQKSLFELLRSTRQSEAQSVVHRNGDIIIMKGGKIVSVRRGSEGSPFLERLKAFKEANKHGRGLAAGLAGTGHVIFGLVCDGVADEENNQNVCRYEALQTNGVYQTEHSHCKEDHMHEAVSTTNGEINCNVEKTNLFKELKEKSRVRDDLKYSRSAKIENGTVTQQSELPDHEINHSSYSVDKPIFIKTVAKGLLDSNTSVNKTSSRNRSKLPLLHTRSDESLSASAISSLHESGIVIHVNDDDDILSVMPLTPQTKEYLAKSDMHIAQCDAGVEKGPAGEAFLFKSHHISHSSEHVLKKPPALQRLPSLEFLDPPTNLFRSHSNVSMHSSVQRLRGIPKSYKKRERSQSPDVGSSSKSSYLLSTFSSRNKVTYL